MTSGSQRPGDAQLVLRRDAAHDHAVAIDERPEHAVVIRQLVTLEDYGLGPARPTSRAIAAAVAGWSPVTITTLIPALPAGGRRGRDPGPRRVL